MLDTVGLTYSLFLFDDSAAALLLLCGGAAAVRRRRSAMYARLGLPKETAP